MRLAHSAFVLLALTACPADPEPAETEGATSAPTSGATDSATSFDPCGTAGCESMDSATTEFDPCGTAGCDLDDGNTTVDCGTGDCCDVNPNFCPPTGTETDTDSLTGTTADTGTSSGTGGSSSG